MKREELQKIWEKDESWRGRGKIFGIYYSKKDPRIFVPKRNLPGGTINFAHPFAYVALLLCLAVPALPVLLLVFIGVPVFFGVAAFLASIAALFLWAYYDSHHRHID